MATLFLKQSRRDKTHEVLITPHKRSAVWGVAVLLMSVVFLATACTKPEKKELAGTWRWTATTGGIAGVWYSPDSEGFEAEIAFKGNRFTFYKDGEKITSGTYSIAYDVDETIYMNKGGTDEPFYSWFHIRFHLSDAEHKKITEATNGKISLGTMSKFVATIGYSETEGQVFSMCEEGIFDGFCYTFVKIASRTQAQCEE